MRRLLRLFSTAPQPPEPIASGTLMVIAPDVGGLYKLLFMKRSAKSSFMPGAHVFPGGALHPVDGETSVQLTGSARFSCQVGCIRETFEETGILPVRVPHGALLKQHRAAVNADTGAFKHVVDILPREALVSTLGSMVHWTTFVTPVFERKRFHTPFYLLILPHSLSDVVQQAASQDDYEAVSVDWLSPQECMQKFNEDAVSLPPPQWLLVNELSRFGSLESLRAETVARSGRPVADIMPHLIGKAKGANGHTVVTLVLPGDETHPTAPGLAGQKCRLQWSPTATGADRMHYEVTVGPSR